MIFIPFKSSRPFEVVIEAQFHQAMMGRMDAKVVQDGDENHEPNDWAGFIELASAKAEEMHNARISANLKKEWMEKARLCFEAYVRGDLVGP